MSNNNDELDDFINKAMGRSAPVKKQNGDWKEIDLTSKFSGMLPKSKEDLMAFAMQQKANQNQQNNSSYNQAFIKEGFDVYKPISNMNNNIDLATPVGNSSDLSGKEFVVHSKGRYLIVKDHKTAIDLSKVDNEKFLTLVVVEAPFIGKLLVPEQAIRNFVATNKSILKG